MAVTAMSLSITLAPGVVTAAVPAPAVPAAPALAFTSDATGTPRCTAGPGPGSSYN
ncbi:MAG: hypothetical protein H0V67_00805 [Geodermatophilaceae bacterium]|nr:hypothetical protein [Geodermatophilaceae bacterium]